MSDYALPCGCIAALEPIGYRMAWAIVRRCDEHPSGDVPVPSMALLDLASPSAARLDGSTDE